MRRVLAARICEVMCLFVRFRFAGISFGRARASSVKQKTITSLAELAQDMAGENMK